MAVRVRVDIKDRLIISELNTPGGDVFRWRDKVAEGAINSARAASPVNNPLNAMHRGGLVGRFKKEWHWDRIGSNQHRVRARLRNDAPHAVFVELGRKGSDKQQTFSWTRWGGEIRTVGGFAGGRRQRGTRGRPGKYILLNATNSVLSALADRYAPQGPHIYSREERV